MFTRRQVLLCSFTLATALAATQAKLGFDAERLGRIPARLKSFVDKGEIAGAVMLVARHGSVASLEAVGYQDLEAKTPMKTDSIFQIMSMTKPITAAGILMLAEEGRLGLLDPVEKHLPEFRGQVLKSGAKPARPITIRDLLTHTSGVPGTPAGPMAGLYQSMDRTLSEAVREFATQPLDFEPGTKWAYSNTGIATLGRIIEVASDQPYDKFIVERLLQPLGMKDSFFFPPAEKTSRIALVYKRQDNALVRSGGNILGGDPTKFRAGAKYPAPEFGLFSTASDLLKWHQMLLNGGTFNGRRYLSKYSIDLMREVHTGDIKAGHMSGTGYGLAVEVVKEPTGTLWYHTIGTFGHGGAFGTQGWIDPQHELIRILLIAREGGQNDVRNAFMAMAASSLTD